MGYCNDLKYIDNKVMDEFIAKIYQSLIDKHQMLVRSRALFKSLKINIKNDINADDLTHSSIAGYQKFENQADSLGGTRKYNRLQLRITKCGEKHGVTPICYFYCNYVTRDLTDIKVSINSIFINNISNFLKTLYLTSIKAITLIELHHPPPLRSTRITDLNLTARLLPSPQFLSA